MATEGSQKERSPSAWVHDVQRAWTLVRDFKGVEQRTLITTIIMGLNRDRTANGLRDRMIRWWEFERIRPTLPTVQMVADAIQQQLREQQQDLQDECARRAAAMVLGNGGGSSASSSSA